MKLPSVIEAGVNITEKVSRGSRGVDGIDLNIDAAEFRNDSYGNGSGRNQRQRQNQGQRGFQGTEHLQMTIGSLPGTRRKLCIAKFFAIAYPQNMAGIQPIRSRPEEPASARV